MATTDEELESDVRGFTGVTTAIVDADDFEIVLNDAKRHIRQKRSMTDEQVDWYGDPAQEEALNWATKLFLKVAAGELDSQTIQVGAIDHNTLLSKDDNSYTLWYRKMQDALRNINPETSFGHTSTERRVYSNDDSGTSGETDVTL